MKIGIFFGMLFAGTLSLAQSALDGSYVGRCRQMDGYIIGGIQIETSPQILSFNYQVAGGIPGSANFYNGLQNRMQDGGTSVQRVSYSSNGVIATMRSHGQTESYVSITKSGSTIHVVRKLYGSPMWNCHFQQVN